jgi:hypothetical protein
MRVQESSVVDDELANLEVEVMDVLVYCEDPKWNLKVELGDSEFFNLFIYKLFETWVITNIFKIIILKSPRFIKTT